MTLVGGFLPHSRHPDVPIVELARCLRSPPAYQGRTSFYDRSPWSATMLVPVSALGSERVHAAIGDPGYSVIYLQILVNTPLMLHPHQRRKEGERGGAC